MNRICTVSLMVGLPLLVEAQQNELEWRRNRALELNSVVAQANNYASQYLIDHEVEEDIEMRRYFRGDIDGDGLSDILLTTSFSPPEGNLWNHDFILVFGDREKEPKYLNFGGKSVRSFSEISIGSTGILVTALYYEPGDGLCCPTREQKLILFPDTDGWTENLVPEPIPGEVIDGYQYRVGTGDTLSMVARKFGLSLKELMDLNPEVDPRRLRVGDILQTKTANKSE